MFKVLSSLSQRLACEIIDKRKHLLKNRIDSRQTQFGKKNKMAAVTVAWRSSAQTSFQRLLSRNNPGCPWSHCSQNPGGYSFKQYVRGGSAWRYIKCLQLQKLYPRILVLLVGYVKLSCIHNISKTFFHLRSNSRKQYLSYQMAWKLSLQRVVQILA